MADVAGYLSTSRFNLPRTSRFRGTYFYPDLDTSYGRWPFNSRTFAVNDSDTYYTVQTGEEFRLDLLAYKIYGSTFLWWVLAVVNDIRNPFTAPYVGDVLRVPALTRVFTILHTI